jgi:hypothetical protein
MRYPWWCVPMPAAPMAAIVVAPGLNILIGVVRCVAIVAMVMVSWHLIAPGLGNPRWACKGGL